LFVHEIKTATEFVPVNGEFYEKKIQAPDCGAKSSGCSELRITL
jgi:hypothetical protein